jgi:hypothetical protein
VPHIENISEITQQNAAKEFPLSESRNARNADEIRVFGGSGGRIRTADTRIMIPLL